MIETHNMWSPFHYDYVQDVNPPRTYYVCVEDSELQAWELQSHYTTVEFLEIHNITGVPTHSPT